MHGVVGVNPGVLPRVGGEPAIRLRSGRRAGVNENGHEGQEGIQCVNCFHNGNKMPARTLSQHEGSPPGQRPVLSQHGAFAPCDGTQNVHPIGRSAPQQLLRRFSARRWRAIFAVTTPRKTQLRLERYFCPRHFHLPACPSLHGRYPLLSEDGRSDSRQLGTRTVCPPRPSALTGLPDYGRTPSDRPVSNHRRVARESPGCQQVLPAVTGVVFTSQTRPSRRPNQLHGGCPFGQPVSRTACSRSVALHVALLGRSYGSIPHDSSPHRSGLSPLRLRAFSGAQSRACGALIRLCQIPQ